MGDFDTEMERIRATIRGRSSQLRILILKCNEELAMPDTSTAGRVKLERTRQQLQDELDVIDIYL